jgi:4-hydroxy-3-methylbut-2-enyl diphosphate reductase IspH
MRIPQGETEQIGKLLEGTMLRKVGPAALKDHFMLMDTICDATQERQDAVTELVSRQEQVHSAGRMPRAHTLVPRVTITSRGRGAG